ncbi:ABC transporter ATP-binding protein [Mycolicibacterium sp. P9-64]|uniref:dipeptide ABC transporter ATP-binding protein n=1 Tax=Mycolicibacterium sp. P9-64 TaxID=2024612 RepID=UPI0011EF5A7B|nr:ABC transporter ATP-binding protein [Mycolicibacterium sp. P9-64]KAA0081795.1 ABC transporter ATP-binding protein [Mycolicibacterium sp. P9-64]
MTLSPVLSVRGLTVGYRLGGDVQPAVHDVGFDLGRGQVLALVGESGSGKTTTGHAILGLLPDNGEVLAGRIDFRGQDLTKLDPKAWREIRGGSVALIPQDPTISLDPVRRVGHQVEDVLRLHTDLDDDGRRDRVHQLCELVGFADAERLCRQYPHELSGGMRQRVLVAAAVAGDPDLIIADEPTSGLDATVQKQVLDLIDELRALSSTSIVLITHDLGVAADRSDLIGVMRQGRIVEFGPTAEVIAGPQHEYTRHLLDSVPRKSVSKRALRSTATSDDPAVAIEVADLTKVYGDMPAVDGISFQVRRGQTFALVGESGSGKSTTARVITGVTPATSGRVDVLGTDITELSSRAYRPLRRHIQVVYQNPYSSFDPRFDVFDVVEEPLRSFQHASLLPGSRRRRRRENADRVVSALEGAALPADFAKRHPRELSGGQRQRVAIARALVVEPEIVVLDEPTSALDVSVAAQILELLQRLQADRGLTYVFISHDLAVVSAISDHVAVLRQGRVVEQGPTDDVFSSPHDPYTVALLDAIAGHDLALGAP